MTFAEISNELFDYISEEELENLKGINTFNDNDIIEEIEELGF